MSLFSSEVMRARSTVVRNDFRDLAALLNAQYHTGARPGVRGGGGSNTVVCHVEALEAKGLVRRLQSAQKARAIRITREGYRALGCLACPTCGTFKVGAAAA